MLRHRATCDRLGLMVVYENRGRYDWSNLRVEDDLVVLYDTGRQIPGLMHIDDGLSGLAGLAPAMSRTDIAAAVDLLYQAWERDGTIFTMGNGGSASTATHLACDLAKFASVPGWRRLKATALVDNIPLVSAWTNDVGFASIFAEQLDPWLREGDVVIGLSVHGGSGSAAAGPWSQSLLRALSLARKRGAKTIGLAGFGGGAMRQMADVCLVVPWDSEPLGTPLVESFDVALHHLLCLALKQRIEASPALDLSPGPFPRREGGTGSPLL